LKNLKNLKIEKALLTEAFSSYKIFNLSHYFCFDVIIILLTILEILLICSNNSSTLG